MKTCSYLFLILLVSACEKSEDVSPIPVTGDIQNEDVVSVPDNTYILMPQTGKPTAPVQIEYRFINPPRAGETIELEIKLNSKLGSILEPELGTGKFLQLLSRKPVRQQQPDSMTPGLINQSSYIERILLSNSQSEKQYLTLSAGIEQNGRRQFRTVLIPLFTEGSAPTKLIPGGRVSRDGQGRAIIENPAN